MAQQAMKLRANDLYNGGASGLRTCWHKIEFDGAFDQVQWLVGSKVASGTPGTYKVQFAVTDQIAVDTINNAWVPMRGGVAYNDTSANGWQNATFGGAATKQIGLAPSASNNSCIHMSTDVMNLASIPRADGKAGGILLVKVVQTDTSGAYTQANSNSSAWDSARTSQAWFREWFCNATSNVDGIATLTTLPTGTPFNGDYVFPGFPIVTTTSTAVPLDLLMFTGDSRKSAAFPTNLFNNPNRMAAMSISSSAHPISTVNAAGSGHSQAQYLQLAMDMLNNGLRPTVIFLPGFSQNGFSTYTAFKTANDNFMSSVRAISGLANVKFVLDTDYYAVGYTGTTESYRQQCISYAKSLANGTTVFCFDSDVIMTDYSSSAPVLRPAYMSGGDTVHAGPPGQNAMAYGDKSGSGLMTMFRSAMAVTDTTAPTLTLPTATVASASTATGTVKTNESGGLLYYLANTSATATAAQVMAGASQAPVAAGTQTVTFTGLAQTTAYYPHYVHTDAAGNVSNVADGASFTIPDSVAPTLSSPSGTATSATTATGSVTTNEANGTLYYLASVNATETVATIKAGASKAVTATGAQAVSFTGLTASTTYYPHFVHTDSAGNTSAVADGAGFTTSAAADTTASTLSAATSAPNGAYAATGSVTTDEGNGTLYYLASTSTSQTAAQVKAGATQAISSAGAKSVAVSNLAASTVYYLYFLHRDAAGNDSAVLRSASFTTAAAPTNTGTIDATKVPASRTVTFPGNKRVVTF